MSHIGPIYKPYHSYQPFRNQQGTFDRPIVNDAVIIDCRWTLCGIDWVQYFSSGRWKVRLWNKLWLVSVPCKGVFTSKLFWRMSKVTMHLLTHPTKHRTQKGYQPRKCVQQIKWNAIILVLRWFVWFRCGRSNRIQWYWFWKRPVQHWDRIGETISGMKAS